MSNLLLNYYPSSLLNLIPARCSVIFILKQKPSVLYFCLCSCLCSCFWSRSLKTVRLLGKRRPFFPSRRCRGWELRSARDIPPMCNGALAAQSPERTDRARLPRFVRPSLLVCSSPLCVYFWLSPFLAPEFQRCARYRQHTRYEIYTRPKRCPADPSVRNPLHDADHAPQSLSLSAIAWNSSKSLVSFRLLALSSLAFTVRSVPWRMSALCLRFILNARQ